MQISHVPLRGNTQRPSGLVDLNYELSEGEKRLSRSPRLHSDQPRRLSFPPTQKNTPLHPNHILPRKSYEMATTIHTAPRVELSSLVTTRIAPSTSPSDSTLLYPTPPYRYLPPRPSRKGASFSKETAKMPSATPYSHKTISPSSAHPLVILTPVQTTSGYQKNTVHPMTIAPALVQPDNKDSERHMSHLL